jgi:hypothetical protein
MPAGNSGSLDRLANWRPDGPEAAYSFDASSPKSPSGATIGRAVITGRSTDGSKGFGMQTTESEAGTDVASATVYSAVATDAGNWAVNGWHIVSTAAIQAKQLIDAKP